MRNYKMLNIGIIGCGTIGLELARAIDKDLKGEARVVAVCDKVKEKTDSLVYYLKPKPLVLSIEGVIEKSDLVIEAASANVSGKIAKKALLASKDVMVMSVGGLLDDYQDLFDLANRKKCHIYLPSGALCGLDGVKSASVGQIVRATLTTRKPPKSLEGAPYFAKNNIELAKIKKETLIFEGTAKEAIRAFPRNINVSATFSLAGIGSEKTRVRIITSPAYRSNIHEIELEGDFGKLTTKTENVPFPQNPKTSYLAIFSAIVTLKEILKYVRVGT